MKYYDPLRQRLTNGRPCWESQPNVALPGLYVTPCEGEGEMFDVELVVDGSWVGKKLFGEQISWLARAWRDDPEGALKEWFEIEPPQGRRPVHLEEAERVSVAITSDKNMEDLGL